MQKKCVGVSVGALAVLLFAATALYAQTPIASVGLSAGWATFGQASPQGAATTALRVGTLTTQTDVKSRWPDGSIKFALVTVNVASAGTYAITAAAAPAGSLTPTLPTASVTLTIGGVAYVAALPSAAATDRWMSGPLAYEGRSVVTPAAGATAHAFLRVVFDTRVYADGKGRVDVTVENVLDKTGATTVTYDASIVLNGTQVFSKAAVQHYYLTRWRKVFPLAGTTFASITPDFFPFQTSRILPKYLSLVDNQVSAPTGVDYDILKSGALDSNMPAHGGRAELAPYPDWTARYLVHKDQTQRSFVLANGDLSGSWPVHLREAEGSANSGVGTERLVSLTQRPTLWYDSRAKNDLLDYVKGSPMPIIEYGSITPGPGQSPLIPDDAHQPSIAYVPYLITGDRYYAEEMAFWANYGMIRTYPADGVRGGDGILAYNEVRGYGWALRNLVEAAAMYPDGPVKTYLSSKALANLQWLDAFANAQNPLTNPFKVMWIGKRPDGNEFISMWEQNYLAYAIDRGLKLGFTAGQAHRDAIARFQLRLFSSDPQYPKAQGAPYIVAVGTPPAGTLYYDSYDSFTFFTSMAQVWAGTAGNERPFAGYYGPEARLNLMMGVEGGWTGAQAAYDYLWPSIGVTPVWGALPDLAQRAGWALDFYPSSSSTPPPPPPPPPPPLPTLTIDRTNLQFGATGGTSFATKTISQTVHLLKGGTGSISWTASSNRAWLTVTPASGTGPATLTITVNYSATVATPATVTGAISVTATGVSNTPGAVGVTLRTYAAGTSAAPFGFVDTPANNTIGVNGSIAMTGWALDDEQVSAVRIMRDPVAGEPAQLMPVGTATFIEGARPDVMAAYPTLPLEYRGGWGYMMLTNMLPNRGNGTFTFHAFADDIDGHSTLLGSRTITCDNAHATAPFGAIDTPGQGATVSGLVSNFGWVLSPGTRRADPPGGGSVSVLVDGAAVGVPAGWTSRSDLSAAFPLPQYAGINTAVAVYGLDTSVLADGVHTIAWIVTDNFGVSSGVGSRFFSVFNGGTSALTAASPAAVAAAPPIETLPIDRSPLYARRGFDLSAGFSQMRADGEGSFRITGEELDRFEVQLDAGSQYAGYLRTPGGLWPLPIGSHLEPSTGVFTWQPSAGFVGRYQFVFVRDSAPAARREIEVVLLPKGTLAGPRVVIDTPVADQRVAQAFFVSGWAVDGRASSGSGIDAVHVWAYPARGGAPIFVGDAIVGGARPDVADSYGPAARDSGYGTIVRGLPPGRYMLAVFGHSTVTRDFLPAATVSITVR
jgi:hypothetical protein